jgi:flagellar basal body-associated protein FliL
MAEENNEATTADDNSPEAQAKAEKKSKKALIIVIALLAVIGAGAGAFFMLKGEDPQAVKVTTNSDESEQTDSSSESTEDTSAQASSGSKSHTEMLGQFGKTMELKPFNLNLGNPLENRYIRLVIAIEYKGGDPQQAELLAKSPKLRDVVVSVVTKKTMEFLLGPDGKDQLRHELFVTMNQSLQKKISAVYITDMLIE